MRTTIDGAGRVVVPKRLREMMHLDPGTEIDIRPMGEGLQIRVLGNDAKVVEKEGLLVFRGNASLAIDIAAFMGEQRELRSKQTVSTPQ